MHTCNELAIYGTHTIATHCEKHKLKNEFNLIEGHCGTCGLEEILNESGVCVSCGNAPRVKVQRERKEIHLKNVLEELDIPILSHDKIIDGGVCNRRRPDFIYDGGDHYIIIECDEHQHRRGEYGCEQTRMWEIAQSLGLPTVFIRYNPDTYRTVSKRKGSAALVQREKLLVKWLRLLLDKEQTPDAPFVTVVYLYYDGWSSRVPATIDEVPHPYYDEGIQKKQDVPRAIADDDPLWGELDL